MRTISSFFHCYCCCCVGIFVSDRRARCWCNTFSDISMWSHRVSVGMPTSFNGIALRTNSCIYIYINKWTVGRNVYSRVFAIFCEILFYMTINFIFFILLFSLWNILWVSEINSNEFEMWTISGFHVYMVLNLTSASLGIVWLSLKWEKTHE